MKKERKIQNIDEANALAFFLAKERLRHLQDVDNINADLIRLKSAWGIEIPDVDVDTWVCI